LQIFSKTLIGPIFFEFIQRKGDDGFGEGNFQALFESIEQEQIRAGEFTAQELKLNQSNLGKLKPTGSD